LSHCVQAVYYIDRRQYALPSVVELPLRSMDRHRIAELLEPFVSRELSPDQLSNISTHIDVLWRWNQKMNLTAVRDPEEMVTRHFGESLFAARQLFPAKTGTDAEPTPIRVLDIGSGAGFPGLPIKIWAPQVSLTLIESNQKKATFLREVARSLALDIEVVPQRAEDYTGAAAAVVTMRAVERFEAILPQAARLVAAGGRLALLIGTGQVAPAASSLTNLQWEPAVPIPLSESRVLQIATKAIGPRV
jgi:16S rRNA (guanine527-N7)-methyltransferase